MKKNFSIFVAFMILFSVFSLSHAENTTIIKATEFLEEEKILVGNDFGDLLLNDTLKRQDSVILLSRLLGEEEVAKNYPIDNLTFKDVKVNIYKPYLAWALDNGYFVGHSPDKFGFGDEITLQQYSTVLLRTLGYEVDFKLATEKAKEIGLLAGIEEGDHSKLKIKRSIMAIMTVNVLATPMNPEKVGDETKEVVTLGQKLKIDVPKDLVKEIKESKLSANPVIKPEDLPKVVEKKSEKKPTTPEKDKATDSASSGASGGGGGGSSSRPPTSPVEPGKPVDPEKPVEPGKPVEPEKPKEPKLTVAFVEVLNIDEIVPFGNVLIDLLHLPEAYEYEIDYKLAGDSTKTTPRTLLSSKDLPLIRYTNKITVRVYDSKGKLLKTFKDLGLTLKEDSSATISAEFISKLSMDDLVPFGVANIKVNNLKGASKYELDYRLSDGSIRTTGRTSLDSLDPPLFRYTECVTIRIYDSKDNLLKTFTNVKLSIYREEPSVTASFSTKVAVGEEVPFGIINLKVENLSNAYEYEADYKLAGGEIETTPRTRIGSENPPLIRYTEYITIRIYDEKGLLIHRFDKVKLTK